MPISPDIEHSERKYEPKARWCYDLIAPVGNTSDIAQIITETARDFRVPIFCFIYQNNGQVHYRITRYPREKYHCPDLTGFEPALTSLIQRGFVVNPDPSLQQYDVETVMGLTEGYGGKELTPEQAIDILLQSSQPDTEYQITSGQIFAATIRPDGTASTYQENALCIKTGEKNLPPIHTFATNTMQERYCIELPNQGVSYMVETIHCSSPDIH